MLAASRPWALGVACLLMGAVACGSGSHADHTEDGSAATLCERDTRAEAFQPGMEKSDGALHVQLLEWTPSRPVKGNNGWTLRLTDAGGAPIDDAAVSATPFMPDHNHGTSTVPEVLGLGDGKYSVSPLYLFMAGLWRITVTVRVASTSAPASVQFLFCVDG